MGNVSKNPDPSPLFCLYYVKGRQAVGLYLLWISFEKKTQMTKSVGNVQTKNQEKRRRETKNREMAVLTKITDFFAGISDITLVRIQSAFQD